MADAARAPRHQALSLAWLLGGGALNLLLALSVSLSPDEAHYALYAQHLDWSYFDHPPLVGWLQRPAWALGGSDAALRLVPMLAWLTTGWALWRFASVWPSLAPAMPATESATPPADPARFALWLWVLSPLPHLLGLALVPDSLLMPLTAGGLALVWQLSDAQQARRWQPWLLLGLGLGLAGLAKYTAVLLALGVALVLAWAHGTRLLRLPGFWLATSVAGMLISPVVVWNAQHGWVSFAYQLQHAAGNQPWRLSRVGLFLVVQGLAFGLLLPAGLGWAWRAHRRQAASTATGSGTQPDPVTRRGLSGRDTAPWGICIGLGLPTLMLLIKLSGRGSTLPHWAAPAWVALLPLAASGLQACWMRRRRWVLALGAWQALGCAAMAALMLHAGLGEETGDQARSLPGQGDASAPRNPVADLYGWDAAAQQARTLAAEQGLDTLAVVNWSLASRIAWYARPLPVKVVHNHRDQFDLWFTALQPGDSVLWVDWSLMSYAPPVGPDQFRSCRPLAQLPTRHGARQIAHFNFLRCDDWRGPPLAPPGATPQPH